MKLKVLISSLSAAALLVLANGAQAAFTVYTTSASFGSATSAPGVDTFTGLSITAPTTGPLARTAGSYAYTATASTSSFYGAGTTANPWLSTNLATDSIAFSGFTGPVRAIAGNFFGSNINGAFAAGDITLTAVDSLGSISTQTITNATTASFLGFASTGTIVSLTVTSVQGATPLWPTVDNLTLATIAAVPEPETYALMLAGIGALGFVARKRRQA